MMHKLEKFVFLALILSIPFQKRTFLFGTDPASSGGFNEWASGFFYFTDFLVFLLVAFWLRDFLKRKNPNPRIYFRFGPDIFLAVLLGFVFLSLSQADLIGVAVYRFIKLAEFISLFFYVVERLKFIGLRPLLGTFVASGIFQSIIAILQFAKQSSLGLEIFHESTLAIHMKGVAHIAADGLFLIRGYGTFPSPNVLAGFLGLCLFFLFYLYLRGASKNTITETFAPPARALIQSSARSSSPAVAGLDTMPARLRVFCNSILRSPNLIYGVLIFFLTFGLILTFSRGTIIFFVLVSALFFGGMFLLKQFQQYRAQTKTLVVLVITSWLLIIAIAWPEFSSRFLGSSFDEPAIQERFFFNKVGVGTVRADPMNALFGIGAGNFVHNFTQSMPGLPEHLYQPVHNIFILIASETGTLGFFTFILFIALLLERLILCFVSALDVTRSRQGSIQDACYSKHLVYYTLTAIFCFAVLISMYDHYFWTLQQGALMFWITLGLVASKIKLQHAVRWS